MLIDNHIVNLIHHIHCHYTNFVGCLIVDCLFCISLITDERVLIYFYLYMVWLVSVFTMCHFDRKCIASYAYC